MTRPADVDRTLRAWFDAEAPIAVPATLVETVVATTGRRRPRPALVAMLAVPVMQTRSAVLVGSPSVRRAAYLAALAPIILAAAAVLAVGTGLARPPWERAPLPPELGACTPVIELGVAAEIWHAVPEGDRLRVMTDGWVVRNDERVARRLSPAGLAAYMTALEESELWHGCLSLSVPNLENDGFVWSLFAASPAGTMDILVSRNSGQRTVGGAEERELLDFIGRVAHPEAWLPESAWIHPEPIEPPVTNWRLIAFPTTVALDRDDPLSRLMDGGRSIADLDMRTMGGSAFLMPGLATLGEFACAEVDGATAAELRRRLVASTSAYLNDYRWVFHSDGETQMGIWLQPIDPRHTSCEIVAAAVRDRMAVASRWARQAPATDPCTIVPQAAVMDLFGGLEGGRALEWRLREYAAAEWCMLRATETATEPRASGLFIHAWVPPVNQDQADGLARQLLGEVETVVQPDGGRLWLKTCDSAVPCMPTIAIWQGSRFVLLEPFAPGVDPVLFRATAEAALEYLVTAPVP